MSILTYLYITISPHIGYACFVDLVYSGNYCLPGLTYVQSSSSASQRQGPRRAHAKPGQTTAPLPQVAFVDLVDSDDDTVVGVDVEELDLELKL